MILTENLFSDMRYKRREKKYKKDIDTTIKNASNGKLSIDNEDDIAKYSLDIIAKVNNDIKKIINNKKNNKEFDEIRNKIKLERYDDNWGYHGFYIGHDMTNKGYMYPILSIEGKEKTYKIASKFVKEVEDEVKNRIDKEKSINIKVYSDWNPDENYYVEVKLFVSFIDAIKAYSNNIVKESAEEKVDLTKYFAFNPEDGMEPSLVGDAEEVFYRDPVYNKAIMEHFDMLDVKTRRTLLSMNEAGQNTVLMNLTSRLYDKIVEKCDDIDYGEIPKTKGDIRKLPKYESMKECIALMHDILKEYNQDTGPVDELSVAFVNVESRKDLFERAYRYNAELPIAMYCNITLGIITGISYMIATCIEFIKDPGAENFRIALDKMAYAKTKDHLIYNTLKSFNKSCATKEFDKAMEAILKASTKNFAAGAILGGIAISVLGIILVLIPVLRELIFMFYYLRVKISDFFDIQADLLQMNAYAIEANTTLSPTERKKVMAKQLKYVEQFRKISNTVAIEMKKAEVASDKEKRSDDETKMLIDDIGGIDPGNKSALF